MRLLRFATLLLSFLISPSIGWNDASAEDIASPAPAPAPVAAMQSFDNLGAGDLCDAGLTRPTVAGLWDDLSFRFAIDGSKQPQDFGVNAHVGGQASMNWGIPLLPDRGLGLQLGTGITATANAVRVYELLGESTGRTQHFTTVGLFQRTTSGWAWGLAHDFLYEDFYDTFQLSQWRGRVSYDVSRCDQFGFTAMIAGASDGGTFGGGTPVTLEPIDQAHVYWRRFWNTGAQTTAWVGVANGHGEDNAVTGFAPPKDESFLLGADVLMPLSRNLAVYGESNLIMPSDTGTVDAFLGIQWYPFGSARGARRHPFSPLLTLASPVSFGVDLLRR